MRRMMTLGLVAGLAAIGVRSAASQTSLTITTSATVLPALSVSGSNLAFGTVASTQTKVVAAAAGGTFQVSGVSDTPVSIFFALPATLGLNVGIGGWTGLSNTSNSSGSASALTVSAIPQTRTLGPSGKLHVWVGATLTTTGAAAGSFSAPVVLTVVYN